MATEQQVVTTAGRDLDAIIHAAVFGKAVKGWYPPLPPEAVELFAFESSRLDRTPVDEQDQAVPYYSTDIREAWKVMEWLDKDAAHPSICFTGGEGADFLDGIEVEFYNHRTVAADPDKSGWDGVWAETAPLAICRAALVVAGVWNEPMRWFQRRENAK